jgi:DNA-binding LacI/PurR family transcriptional regulator
MKQGQIPTLKEIAKKLKLSTSTVSRALKDHPSIGLVTTMRVKKLAAELHYEPDSRAIFFKQQKSFTIGVVLPNLSEAFFSTAITAIEDRAADNHYTVILGQSLDNEERELRILKSFKKHRVDGVIISLSKNTTNFDFIETFKKANIPVVFFDCVPDRDDVYRIVSDLETGMIEAINTFVSCGHHRIALINGPETLLASKQREEGFIKGLELNDIEVDRDCIFHTNLSQKGNYDAVEELLSLVDRPSAVICFSDYVTLDAMKLVREKGLIINQDIFFISFANFPIWNHIENKPMASIEQFPDKQAEKAVEILFDLIKEGKTDKGNHIIYPSRLIHLDTV